MMASRRAIPLDGWLLLAAIARSKQRALLSHSEPCQLSTCQQAIARPSWRCEQLFHKPCDSMRRSAGLRGASSQALFGETRTLVNHPIARVYARVLKSARVATAHVRSGAGHRRSSCPGALLPRGFYFIAPRTSLATRPPCRAPSARETGASCRVPGAPSSHLL